MESLRQSLIKEAGAYGLLVAGYSGRDESVMSCLRGALAEHGSGAFPEGLFWCVRPDDPRADAVTEFLASAAGVGIRAHWAVVPDFDDLMSAVYRACELTNPVVDSELAESRPSRAGYALKESSSSTDLVKLAAIHVTDFPSSGYRFKSLVGSWAELREVVEGHPLVASLHGGFVHALGTRDAIVDAFRGREVRDLQPEPLGKEDLRRPNSRVLGMFYDAITTGLATAPYLERFGGRHRMLYIRDESHLPPGTGCRLLRTGAQEPLLAWSGSGPGSST